MFMALVVALRYVQHHIQPLRHFIQEVTAAQGEESPAPVIVVEGVRALIVLLAAFIMTRIEKRSFADYRLPMNQAFGKRFWQGLALGFAMLSLLLVAIGSLHGFSLAGLAVGGLGAVKFGLLWALAFFLVGVFEDFMFRGYLQSALGDEIGFWPAALILAVIFGAIHWNNQGEALFGCVTAGMFGFMEAFALSRTGSLWLLFGMHTSWDWGETYFYGTPDSGIAGERTLIQFNLPRSEMADGRNRWAGRQLAGSRGAGLVDGGDPLLVSRGKIHGYVISRHSQVKTRGSDLQPKRSSRI